MCSTFGSITFKLYGITRSYFGCLFLCALGMTVFLAKSIYHTISAHRHVFTIEVLVCVCGTLNKAHQRYLAFILISSLVLRLPTNGESLGVRLLTSEF